MFGYKNPISYEPSMSFLIHSRALMCAFLICGISFIFPSCLMPRVSKSSFFNSISYIALVASIRMFEHKNSISYDHAMNELLGFLTCSSVCVPYLWHKFSFSFMTHAPTLKIKFFQFHIIDCLHNFDSHF